MRDAIKIHKENLNTIASSTSYSAVTANNTISTTNNTISTTNNTKTTTNILSPNSNTVKTTKITENLPILRSNPMNNLNSEFNKTSETIKNNSKINVQKDTIKTQQTKNDQTDPTTITPTFSGNLATNKNLSLSPNKSIALSVSSSDSETPVKQIEFMASDDDMSD